MDLTQRGGEGAAHVQEIGRTLLCSRAAVDPARVFAGPFSAGFTVRALAAAVRDVGAPGAAGTGARALVSAALCALLAADALAPAQAAAVGAELCAVAAHGHDHARAPARARPQRAATEDALAALDALGRSVFVGGAPRADVLLAFLGAGTRGLTVAVRVAALRCLARRLDAWPQALDALRAAEDEGADILWTLAEQYCEEADADTATDADELLGDLLRLRL